MQHEFLVLAREERRQANGDPFVILTLGNATGRIATAPVWLNQHEWIAGAEQGRVVQVIGEIAEFQHRRQLRLTSALRVLPAESVTAESFLPRITVPVAQLWDWVDRARGELKSVTLRRVVDRFFADDAFRVEFERAPASVSRHHALVGGLLLHTIEVATLARSAARVLKANTDLVVAGGLLHDVGKVRAFDITPTGFSWTPMGRLVGAAAMVASALDERLAALVPNELLPLHLAELHHVVQCAQGERSATPATVEGEILQMADGLSVRAADITDALSDEDSFSTDVFSDRPTLRTGRRVWRRSHSWD